MFSRAITLFLVAILFCGCYSLSPSTPNKVHDLSDNNKTLEWWQNAVFYQIYPRSFQDSDDDGVGDLQGIISKLSYLKDTGVTATWLSPIFESPGIDQGYDISNYEVIDKLFGTMKDFEALIAEAKKLGIKIILDFVPNHTSDEHEWFQKSENREKGYEDYYVWVNGNQSMLPNNWHSAFSGPTWTWSTKRNQYYYHQFDPKQPDLNYTNPAVVKAMKNVLKFWMDKGVSGFRMDAVNFLFEDTTWRNASVLNGYKDCPESPNCQEQISLMKDLESTYDMVYQFREFIDQYVKDNKKEEPIIMMTESYTTLENTMLYYQTIDGARKGAHFTFNFNFITSLKKDYNVDDIVNSIDKWLIYLPQGRTSNWVLGNHDNHRVATRLGEENVDGFNMLTAFLPGVMVTYNGEEIGMIDGEVSWDQRKDPSAKNESTFNETSRDFERTPFQWDNTTNGGFTNGTPWLPVGSSRSYINLKAEEVEGVDSHYSIYKRLMEFKNNFQNASATDYTSVIKISDNILQVVRQRDNIEFVYLFNIGESKENVDFYKKSSEYSVEVASINSTHKLKSIISGSLEMEPHESLILRGTSTSGAQSVVFSLSLVLLLNLIRYLF